MQLKSLFVSLFTIMALPAVDLMEELKQVRQQHDLPAMGLYLWYDGQERACLVNGVRQRGTTTTVTTDDLWHIGSCTKSMTATLIMRAVEEKKLRLSDPLLKHLRVKKPHADWQDVPLWRLLDHTAGVMRDPPLLLLNAWSVSKDSDLKKRRQLVQSVLTTKPSFLPGKAKEYSNGGYILAGALLEKVWKKPWQRLMHEQLFKPLGMDSAGFGPTAKPSNKPKQPIGHKANGQPLQAGDLQDNLSPAGTVHASLRDIGRYVRMHCRSETGPVLNQPASFQRLQKVVAPSTDYALGWGAYERPWGKGIVHAHSGSNTFNYCSIWFAPQIDLVVVAVTNSGQAGAAAACDQAVGAAIRTALTP